MADFSPEYLALSKRDQANELLTFAKDNINSDNDEEAKYWIVHAFYALTKYNEAIQHGNIFLKELNNKTWIGRIYNRIGAEEWTIGNFDKAWMNYVKAEEILKDFGGPRDYGGVLNNMGLMQDQRGDFNSALDYFKRSVDRKRKVRGLNTEATTLVNIGIVYDRIGDYQSAIKIFTEANR